MSDLTYPIGTATFGKIRHNGWFYVDKTDFIPKLLSEGQYLFLSRPRRFGKSLLVSTLEAYFHGEASLFSGLRIDETEKEWITYPVLHLDLSQDDMTKHESLISYLDTMFTIWEREYAVDIKAVTPGTRFLQIIRYAKQRSGRDVVILIDEYDNPLFSTMARPEENVKMRETLKGIYSVLKAQSANIKFCFLTGITRFSKMSVFSGLNNLRDITLNHRFSGICGITQKELEENCREGVRNVADNLAITYTEALTKLKEQYDGYHFGDMNLDVYNPFSLIQALADGKLLDYWFVSGTSQFLWERISNLSIHESLSEVLDPVLNVSDLGATEDDGLSLPGLLFQTGYLTLKREYEGNNYRLGIPNKEVETGIMRRLLPMAAKQSAPAINAEIFRLRDLADKADIDAFMKVLKNFMASIPYRLSENKREVYFQNNLFIILSLVGLECREEVQTSYSRMDLFMRTTNYIYVIEVKLNRTARQALEQIKKKEYDLPFERHNLPIVRLGINFSTRTHNISTWAYDITGA